MTKEYLTIKEVANELGVSVRTVKYWLHYYHLPVIRKGRQNLYPPKTRAILRAIHELIETDYVTMHYIEAWVRVWLQQQTHIPDQRLKQITQRVTATGKPMRPKRTTLQAELL